MSGITLESLSLRTLAVVASVDWPRLSLPEGRRLRELGFDEGVMVEVLHRAGRSGGPLACRIGRMTIALRRSVAAAVHVDPQALSAAAE